MTQSTRLPGQMPHPLLGRYDKDPGPWRPLFYRVEVTVGDGVGDRGIASIALNSQPYILTRIQHKIVGPTADPGTSGLYQDGQYDIAWRDEYSNYQSPGFAPADLMFGSVATGYALDLPYPIPFAGNKTLTFEVQNRVARAIVAPPATEFIVAIVLHGIADWGEIRPNQ